MSSKPMVRPSIVAGRASSPRVSTDCSPVGSSTMRFTPSPPDLSRHRLAARGAVGPSADDGTEEAGAPTGPHDEQAARPELREGGVAERLLNALGHAAGAPHDLGA